MKLTFNKKYEKNPFMVELKGRMYLQPKANTIVAKGEAILDKATGELTEGGVLLGRKKIVDKSQFAKIYASELGILFDLSKTAINVFLYLSKIMDYENKAYFSYTTQYQKANYKSSVACFKGLRELLSKNIIAPSTMVNVWWLNPTIVCKGERFAVYTEYVASKQPILEGNEQIFEQIKEKNNRLDEATKRKKKIAEQQDLFNDLN